MWKCRVCTIVLLLLIPSFNFIFTSTYSYDINEARINEMIFDSELQLPDKIQSDTHSPISCRSSTENNAFGGSWADNFDDNSEIESISNLKKENNNYRLTNDSISTFYDRFEGSDGTNIDTYDSEYTVQCTVASNYDAELDTAQKHEGSTSAWFYLNDWAENVWINRTVDYDKPVLELTYFTRMYTVGGANANVGCSFAFLPYSGTTRLTTVSAYGRYFYYNNGGSFTSTGVAHQANTWYKYRVVLYKINGLYSNYDFSVWEVSDLQTPKVSKTGVSIGASGISVIDQFIIRMRSVWDTECNSWFDRLSIIESGFNSPGVLRSKAITLPQDMYWDSFNINKTQFTGSSIYVDILNAANDQVIYGSITSNDEIDIRDNVDSSLYPSIKLRATFDSHGQTSAILNSWCVSWNATDTWRDTLFGGLKSSKINVTADAGNCTSIFTFTDWDKYASNPVLNDGPSSSFDDDGAMYPAVIYTGTEYMMYYTGLSSGGVWKIGLATSSNGITWSKYSSNPVLSPSTGTAWDDYYIGRPNVIFDGKTYKMWYQGGKSTGNVKIGYATSNDGYTWLKHPSNPVLDVTGTGSWETNGVYAPNVIFDGVKYSMWFSGQDSSSTHRIGYASSYDGINWTKYKNNPVLTGLTGSSQGVMNLFVMQKYNKYLGWHSYDYGSYSEIYHAYSNDGITWIKVNNPAVPRSSSSAWDDTATFAPEVILKDNKYYIYYSGRTGSSSKRIGFAVSNYKATGLLTSEQFNIPPKHYYDELIINKTEPAGTYINISILDAVTLNPITGFNNLRSNSIDLTHLSPLKHPSIILKATFYSNGKDAPTLYDWAFNWTRNRPPRISDISAGTSVNRTHSYNITINLTDAEDSEYNLTLKVEYQSPIDVDWQTQYLTAPIYNIDHWVTTFAPPAEANLGQYLFRFTCNDSFEEINLSQKPNYIEVINNKPIIWKVESNLTDVNRTKTVKIQINSTDVEISNDELTIRAKYKSPFDSIWKLIPDEFITFVNNDWELTFTPSKTAALGSYIFNISSNDTVTEVFEEIGVNILNNIPHQPHVTITPSLPHTMDNLEVFVTDVFDIETSAGQLEFWYHWFKNDTTMLNFDNSTTIPSEATTKNETWRCEVQLFDGVDISPTVMAEVTIINTPPKLENEFKSVELYEDTSIVLENKLSDVFSDADNDTLIYSYTGQEHISIIISQNNGTLELIPEKNWFGIERITFYANDTFSTAAAETVIIFVYPTNDLPKIVRVGNKFTSPGNPELTFTTYEDDLLNLEIVVEDIDGDVERNQIQYSVNISDPYYMFLDLNTIVFSPENDDVGWHFANISVTDNNETPFRFVYQNIKIYVENINDPPSVQILKPINNMEYISTDIIQFNCTAIDIDLFIRNSNERLTYSWMTNISEYRNLGNSKYLSNITLPAGYYNITVLVSDSAGATDFDSVNIIVTEAPKKETTPSEKAMDNYLWLLLVVLIIIIIIIIGIIAYILHKQKKEHMLAYGLQRPEVLQPVDAYLPAGGTTGPGLPAAKTPTTTIAAAPTQELLGPSTPTPSASAQPPDQLPPAQLQPTIQPQPTVEETKAGMDVTMTPQQKLDLLEERLVRGEIDQDIYLSLKAKFEMEAKPYEPPPQLPPGPSMVPTTTEPIQPPQQPTQPVQPQIQPQAQPQVQPPQPQVQQPMPQTSAPITSTPAVTPGTEQEKKEKPLKEPE